MATKPRQTEGDRQFQYMEISGHTLRVHCRDMASDQRPLLVCNGLGQGIEILFPLLQELGGRPIIAFDAVGAGKSSVPADPLTIGGHAKLVKQMLDGLGVTEYDVLGISWGGGIAQQLAHCDPAGCKRLVLAATSAGGLGSWWGTPVALSEILMPLRFTNKAYANFIGPYMYGGEALFKPDLFKEYSRNSITPSYSGYAAQVSALLSWTSLGWLHEIEQPTLVICGIFDGLIPPANQFLLATCIPNAELRIFPAGHLLMYSMRSQIGGVMTQFLDRATPRD